MSPEDMKLEIETDFGIKFVEHNKIMIFFCNMPPSYHRTTRFLDYILFTNKKFYLYFNNYLVLFLETSLLV